MIYLSFCITDEKVFLFHPEITNHRHMQVEKFMCTLSYIILEKLRSKPRL